MELKLNAPTVHEIMKNLWHLTCDVERGLKQNPDDAQLKSYAAALENVTCILNSSGIAGEDR